MSETGFTTLDPLGSAIEASDKAESRRPTLELLFHSELARIGQRAPIDLPLNAAVTVGRESPIFEPFGLGAGTARALSDPCISRQQFTIERPSRYAFSISPCGARPLQLRSLTGENLAVDQPVPGGTLIAVGDRALLLIAMGRDRAEADRMELVGESEAMWTVRTKTRSAASSDSTVLIQGESGAGKELVARAIHAASPRKGAPHLAVNCAAIPQQLLESELFGHVKGSFTGASADKDGFFRGARNGTLFLDEIGELPLEMQGKLLRVLQERKVCPVGGLREETVQARVIAATNRDLRREVSEGRFREDLYYRLSTLTIDVPPLRQRREDIPALFKTFLQESTQRHPTLKRLWRDASQYAPPIPMTFMIKLIAHDWPGNVRQLRNVVERAAVANLESSGFVIPAEVEAELTERPQAPAGSTEAQGAGRQSESINIDDDALRALLEEHDYVQRRVARALGVSHTTLDRRMRALGVRRPRDIEAQEIEQAAQQTSRKLDEMASLLRVSKRGLKLRMKALGIDCDAAST